MNRQYLAVTANHSSDLTVSVNKYIGEGWTPFGGVSVASGPEIHGSLGRQVVIIYAQAMIKEPTE